MDFCMTLEIVLANEAFLAVRALILAVTEMSLYMGLDILLSSETLLAVWIKTQPFTVNRIRTLDEGCNVIDRDTCICKCLIDVDAGNGLGTSVA